jgi:hypothetical protein
MFQAILLLEIVNFFLDVFDNDCHGADNKRGNNHKDKADNQDLRPDLHVVESIRYIIHVFFTWGLPLFLVLIQGIATG